MSLNCCFIGAGNLATQLSKVLQNKGFNISQVYSRSAKSAKLLAGLLKTNYTISISDIDSNADIYFVAVKDSVQEELLTQIDFNNKLVVHCSGSLPLSTLEKYSENIGVFYPLQTFSKNRFVDFSSIPIFIESNSFENEKILQEIACKISNSVTVLDSDARKTLHISAVFASNFVNHFYTISSEILKTKNIPLDVLKPLILETAQKIQKMDPKKAQTGPAVRFDENIIAAHTNELRHLKNYEELYNSISKSIFEHHSK
jgi:predicted short-subunit dehydrogenase-like oxidoreductase (DUF2520 family)